MNEKLNLHFILTVNIYSGSMVIIFKKTREDFIMGNKLIDLSKKSSTDPDSPHFWTTPFGIKMKEMYSELAFQKDIKKAQYHEAFAQYMAEQMRPDVKKLFTEPVDKYDIHIKDKPVTAAPEISPDLNTIQSIRAAIQTTTQNMSQITQAVAGLQAQTQALSNQTQNVNPVAQRLQLPVNFVALPQAQQLVALEQIRAQEALCEADEIQLDGFLSSAEKLQEDTVKLRQQNAKVVESASEQYQRVKDSASSYQRCGQDPAQDLDALYHIFGLGVQYEQKFNTDILLLVQVINSFKSKKSTVQETRSHYANIFDEISRSGISKDFGSNASASVKSGSSYATNPFAFTQSHRDSEGRNSRVEELLDSTPVVSSGPGSKR